MKYDIVDIDHIKMFAELCRDIRNECKQLLATTDLCPEKKYRLIFDSLAQDWQEHEAILSSHYCYDPKTTTFPTPLRKMLRTQREVDEFAYTWSRHWQGRFGVRYLRSRAIDLLYSYQEAGMELPEAESVLWKKLEEEAIHYLSDTSFYVHLILAWPEMANHRISELAGFIATRISLQTDLRLNKSLASKYGKDKIWEGLLTELPGVLITLDIPHITLEEFSVLHQRAAKILREDLTPDTPNRALCIPHLSYETIVEAGVEFPSADTFSEIELRLELGTQLQFLTDLERNAILLEAQDYQEAEIADLLQKTIYGVKDALKRGRKKLRNAA